jgi:hypothetical protein
MYCRGDVMAVTLASLVGEGVYFPRRRGNRQILVSFFWRNGELLRRLFKGL